MDLQHEAEAECKSQLSLIISADCWPDLSIWPGAAAAKCCLDALLNPAETRSSK